MALNFPSIATYGVFSIVDVTDKERAILYCSRGYLSVLPDVERGANRIANVPTMPTFPGAPRMGIW